MTQQPAAAPQTAAERLAARNKTLEEAGYHIRLMDSPGNERTQRDAGEAIDTLLAENAQLRSIISDLYWMARRYADGRSTYAPSTYNAAIKRAIALDCHLPHCVFSWNRNPATGLIFIQSGPRWRGSTLTSGFLGGCDWNAYCGDDRQDPPGIPISRQVDQGDLPGVARVAQSRAEGHSIERDRVPI